MLKEYFLFLQYLIYIESPLFQIDRIVMDRIFILQHSYNVDVTVPTNFRN
jgi:hypothetical protein